MSKETVAGIGKAIEEAQKAKNLKEQQEASRQQAVVLRQEANERALFARNEARLRATGVVELFEELRDSKVLTMFKAGDPAIIKWGPDKKAIFIIFDGYSFFQKDSDGGGQMKESNISLCAEILGSGKLLIGEHLMGRREKLEDVVRDEILRLKGLRE